MKAYQDDIIEGYYLKKEPSLSKSSGFGIVQYSMFKNLCIGEFPM